MSDRAIIEAVNKMSGQHKIDQVTYCDAEVLSVDIVNRTCSCKCVSGHTSYDLPTVALMATSTDGLLYEPVIGSIVKVIFSVTIEPFVCQYSEIENITFIANSKVYFNGSDFGGMVKVDELTSKLNNLISQLSSFITTFNTHTHAVSGAATLVPNALGTAPSTFRKSDYENTDIQHGTTF